jgi:hypothetical protein
MSRTAVIRYCRTDAADVVLMAGLPLLAPPTSLNQLDGLLMVKLPFRDDLRQFTFRTFNDPSKPQVRRHCVCAGSGDPCDRCVHMSQVQSRM